MDTVVDKSAGDAVRPRPDDGSSQPARRLIQVSGLSHRFDGRSVLELASWSVDRGGHALVLGPSGSGKTTLFNILTGLTAPTSGAVVVDGVDLAALPAARRDRARGRLFGIVFQSLRLVSSLTVRQNLRAARSLAGKPAAEDHIADMLAALGLDHCADAKPRHLSQGEAQRAAIARAAIVEAPIIVADEPTSALDRTNAHAVIDLLMDVCGRTGATLIVATHDDRIVDRFDHALRLTPPAAGGTA